MEQFCSTEQFSDIINFRLKKIVEVLEKKNAEYGRKENRLYNFSEAARYKRTTVPDIIWNRFALKHLISVNDLVEDVGNGVKLSEDLVDEKIGDLINYLILLEISLKSGYTVKT